LSFSMIPDVENYEELDKLLSELHTAGILGTNKKGSKTFQYSFSGSVSVCLLSFFVSVCCFA
jgi:hypothetical protein